MNHHNLFWTWIVNLQGIGNLEDDIDNNDTLSPACATRQWFMMIMVMKKMVMWSCGRGWLRSRKIANLEGIFSGCSLSDGQAGKYLRNWMLLNNNEDAQRVEVASW